MILLANFLKKKLTPFPQTCNAAPALRGIPCKIQLDLMLPCDLFI